MHTNILAGKSLGKFHVVEAAQTAALNDIVKHFTVGPILLSVQRAAATLTSQHQDFVLLEVGGLEQHASAIAQFQLLVTESLVVTLIHDFTILGQFRDQRLLLHIVNVGGDLGGLGGIDGVQHTFLGRIDGTVFLLIEVHHHHVLAIQTNEIGQQLVDVLNRDLGSYCSHVLVIVLYRHQRLVVQEVAVALRGIDTVVNLVALVVLTFK